MTPKKQTPTAKTDRFLSPPTANFDPTPTANFHLRRQNVRSSKTDMRQPARVPFCVVRRADFRRKRCASATFHHLITNYNREAHCCGHCCRFC